MLTVGMLALHISLSSLNFLVTLSHFASWTIKNWWLESQHMPYTLKLIIWNDTSFFLLPHLPSWTNDNLGLESQHNLSTLMLILRNSTSFFSQAEEITLTIGQAFDLAYKKFMETSGKDIDMKKQFILLQKKVWARVVVSLLFMFLWTHFPNLRKMSLVLREKQWFNQVMFFYMSLYEQIEFH